jgi:hypothetical protein
MTFYAVVTDDDFKYAPLVRLIKTGPAPGPLLDTAWFEPYGSYSKLDRDGIAITQGAPIVLKSTTNNQAVPAHVCQLDIL